VIIAMLVKLKRLEDSDEQFVRGIAVRGQGGVLAGRVPATAFSLSSPDLGGRATQQVEQPVLETHWILPRSTVTEAFGNAYEACGLPSTVDLSAGPSGFA